MTAGRARTFTPQFFRLWAGFTAVAALLTGAVQATYDVARVGVVDLPTLLAWLALAVLAGSVWLVLRIRTRA